MGPLQEIGHLIVQTLGSLYLLIVMLRFLLQLARADFYNPISQFAVKATNPLLIPIRRVVPGIFGIDMSSLVLGLIIQILVFYLSAFIFQVGGANPVNVLVWSLVGLLSLVANIFFWGLLIMVIASWVAPHSQNPALLLVRQLVEPVMAPFRKLIPDMGGIDISPIFAFLALNVVQILIRHLAAATGMGPAVQQMILGI
ncbi:YggT family protein [Pseudomaricurvus alkylphenolicus]|jgi:YggT family protein|uniref:YggT family protein n=1 Tax=Pseudomaricurvus alkylphenolicus TaxID=1306991 RepID=UPI0014228EC2|nr:YggT family protein [Pseudomaricurvus alkylphenolicus]NIB39386.1 YggT family protein [Pseudomaricurvus alkylphenolicus]